MEKNNIAKFPRPVTKRIPNFEVSYCNNQGFGIVHVLMFICCQGASQACDNLPDLDAFKKAQTVKVNPDKPQEQARFLVLEVNTHCQR